MLSSYFESEKLAFFVVQSYCGAHAPTGTPSNYIPEVGIITPESIALKRYFVFRSLAFSLRTRWK